MTTHIPHAHTLTHSRSHALTHSQTFSRIFIYILRFTHAFTHIYTHVQVLMFMHAPSPSGLSAAVGEVTGWQEPTPTVCSRGS